MGAPRPAASPFLAHDHCARYGCERSPSRQAKTIHFAVGGGCRADEPKWHAVRLEKNRVCVWRFGRAHRSRAFTAAKRSEQCRLLRAQ